MKKEDLDQVMEQYPAYKDDTNHSVCFGICACTAFLSKALLINLIVWDIHQYTDFFNQIASTFK